MTPNLGATDRTLRIAIGLILIAYAIPLGFSQTGWNWVGWIGVIPILTAIFSFCPIYKVLVLSTCPVAHPR